MEIRSRGAWWAVAALVLATLTGGFDITVLNVALPTIGSQLGAGTTALQWMVNAYVLVFACLILPMGAAGDRWGRRRVLLGGLALFTAGSVLAAWAGSAALVIAARAVMGVGMAMVLPMTLATLAVLFPSPQERSRAVAAVIAATGLGVPLGPLVGGWLLERYWWGSVFLINVPIAIAALAAIAVLVPESADPAPPRADFTGAALGVAGLAGFTYAVIETPLRGWGSPAVLTTLGAGLALLAALVAWERRTDHPLIDGALFRHRSFAAGSGAAALAGVALFALLFVIPMYLQLVRGHPPMATGLRLLPVVLGLVVGAASGEATSVGSIFRDIVVRVTRLSDDGSRAFTEQGTIDLQRGQLPDETPASRDRLHGLLRGIGPGDVLAGSGWTDPRNGQRYLLIPATA